MIYCAMSDLLPLQYTTGVEVGGAGTAVARGAGSVTAPGCRDCKVGGAGTVTAPAILFSGKFISNMEKMYIEIVII